MCFLFFFFTIQMAVDVGSGVSIGPLSGRHAAPAVVGRLGLVLEKYPGLGTRTADETGLLPQTSLVLRTGNRNGTRISISVIKIAKEILAIYCE